MTYGSGSVSGTQASDTIHVGSSLSSPLTFGLATNVSDEFRAYPMDGILGIGRGSTTKNAGDIDAPQIMDVLSSSELIAAKLYGIHLSRAKDGLNDGALDIGHIDTTRFSGDLNYMDCVPNDAGFWEIPVQGASVDGHDIALSTPSGSSNSSRTAIMDTGTSFILMPAADAAALHAPITGQTRNGESFFVPCTTQSVLAFSFNNTQYNISSADWIGDKVQGDSRDLCRSNIIGRQTFGASQWLVGDVFLKNVYAVFDFDQARVGLGVNRVEEVDTASATAATATPTSGSSSSTGSSGGGGGGAAAASPTVSAAAEKTPQDQKGAGVSGAADSSSSVVALVVALTAISLFM